MSDACRRQTEYLTAHDGGPTLAPLDRTFRSTHGPVRPATGSGVDERRHLRRGHQEVRRRRRRRAALAADRERRVHGPARPLRLRQVHGAADDRGPRGDHQRHPHDRRARREPHPPARPRHRDGVPELRALSAHDRRQEHRVAARREQERQGRRRGARAPCRGGRSHPRPLQVPGPQARRALRRAAPACGARTGDRASARGLLDGRAAVEPRRQAADPDPPGARRAASSARHHHRLRHPRPGRGHDHGRPHRRDQRRTPPAGRTAPGGLRASRQPVRGQLHRQPTDEHRPRDPGGRGRRTGGAHLGGHRPGG